MELRTSRVARRDRDFVRVAGPDAEDYLQRMLSQDVAMPPGDAREALLLTAKARVIAPMIVLRRSHDDYLLSTEQGLGQRIVGELRRARFAAKVEIEPERHDALVVFGPRPDGTVYPVADFGEPAWETLDAAQPDGAEPLDAAALELMRIRAGTPATGREIDERILPAEAGLTDRAVSFTKGCYPGQEPVARLHYRGHANRSLRVLALEGEPPAYDAPLQLDGKEVGRVTSAVADPAGGVLALAYVRREVPPDAELRVGQRAARQLH